MTRYFFKTTNEFQDTYQVDTVVVLLHMGTAGALKGRVRGFYKLYFRSTMKSNEE